MPATSAKNLPLSPAGADLGLNAGGLGEDMTQQLQEQETQRKKKLLGQPTSALDPTSAAFMLLGGASA